MGVVLRATDMALGRVVAIKFLSVDLVGDPASRARFDDEARMAAAIEHPGAVPIYELGGQGGLRYIVMRYLPGRDLRAILDRDVCLAPTRAVELLEPIAGALDAAHALDLVHGDVKAANVIVVGHAPSEQAFLVDFGVARRLPDAHLRRPYGLGGTPATMAPEVIAGCDVDGRADQYSLAFLLHQCLTGSPPCHRSATVAHPVERDEPACHVIDPVEDLSPAIKRVVERGLAKRPEDRYPRCADLFAALREAVSGLVEEQNGQIRRVADGHAQLHDRLVSVHGDP